MKRRRVPAARGGFSLAELLTVVAIVAVVAALALPALSRALDRSKTLRCLSNLRQIGAGFHLYAADHDGELPYSIDSSGAVTWTGQIAPYLNVTLAASGALPQAPFRCPASKYVTYGGSRAHYGHNYYINSHDPGGDNPNHAGYRLASIPAPASYYLVGDSTLGANGSAARDIGYVNHPQQTATSIYWLEMRHAGRANVVFCDLHAESLTIAQVGAATAGPPWAPRGL